MNVGFIGLGIMGTPMAGHLIDAGHTLFVYDVFKIPEALTAKGATAAASSAESGEECGRHHPHGARYPACGRGAVRGQWRRRGPQPARSWWT